MTMTTIETIEYLKNRNNSLHKHALLSDQLVYELQQKDFRTKVTLRQMQKANEKKKRIIKSLREQRSDLRSELEELQMWCDQLEDTLSKHQITLPEPWDGALKLHPELVNPTALDEEIPIMDSLKVNNNKKEATS